jgi:hypothetical protein
VHGWGRWTSDEGCCIKDATSGLSGDAKAGFSGDATMERRAAAVLPGDRSIGRMTPHGCLLFYFLVLSENVDPNGLSERFDRVNRAAGDPGDRGTRGRSARPGT